jgi:hypothetical protein
MVDEVKEDNAHIAPNRDNNNGDEKEDLDLESRILDEWSTKPYETLKSGLRATLKAGTSTLDYVGTHIWGWYFKKHEKHHEAVKEKLMTGYKFSKKKANWYARASPPYKSKIVKAVSGALYAFGIGRMEEKDTDIFAIVCGDVEPRHLKIGIYASEVVLDIATGIQWWLIPKLEAPIRYLLNYDIPNIAVPINYALKMCQLNVQIPNISDSMAGEAVGIGLAALTIKEGWDYIHKDKYRKCRWMWTTPWGMIKETVFFINNHADDIKTIPDTLGKAYSCSRNYLTQIHKEFKEFDKLDTY